MTTSIGDNRAARDAILSRVRKALGKTGADAASRARAEARIAAHAQGPRPAVHGDLVNRFVRRATDMESTVERIGSLPEIPVAVRRYIDALELRPDIADQKSYSGVCWPEFAGLNWSGSDLTVEARPTLGHDRLGITGSYCAIAETGTLVFLSEAQSPTATALLPDTHIAVVRAKRVVAGMEEAFAMIRAEHGKMPRAMNMISGPSRTGDIEQTIVLGAHGPFRVHILLLE